MIDNPLAGLVPHLAPRDRGTQPSWGVVSGLDPLRVTLPTPGPDGDTDFSPLPLVPLSWLTVGQKVRLSWMGRTALLTHRTYGGAQDHTRWETLPLAGSWSRYSSSFGAPEIMREGSLVHLAGLAAGPDGGGQERPVTTALPEWARPRTNRIITVSEEGQPVDLQVTPAGALWLRTDLGPVTWLSLDGVHYPI